MVVGRAQDVFNHCAYPNKEIRVGIELELNLLNLCTNTLLSATFSHKSEDLPASGPVKLPNLAAVYVSEDLALWRVAQSDAGALTALFTTELVIVAISRASTLRPRVNGQVPWREPPQHTARRAIERATPRPSTPSCPPSPLTPPPGSPTTQASRTELFSNFRDMPGDASGSGQAGGPETPPPPPPPPAVPTVDVAGIIAAQSAQIDCLQRMVDMVLSGAFQQAVPPPTPAPVAAVPVAPVIPPFVALPSTHTFASSAGDAEATRLVGNSAGLYMAHLLEMNQRYEWSAVVQYHIQFHLIRRREMANGDYSGWAHADADLMTQFLFDRRRSSPSTYTSKSSSSAVSKDKSSKPRSEQPCYDYNKDICTTLPCPGGQLHKCRKCLGDHTEKACKK
ncbi:hypothetical protein C8J57DRAFT_1256789 [Mycena rebaudengoi]|nr:hypothetical protein C8J57DRAFT_1256789 [Mycena rebaudengoi]